MPFNISDFSTHIKRFGVLQTNRYEVSIPVPSILLSNRGLLLANLTSLNGSTIQQNINFRAEQVRIPGIDIQTIDNTPQGIGLTQSFPTHVRFTDPSITFLDNQNNDLYKYFYAWKNSIVDYSGFRASTNAYNPQTDYEVAYKDNYTVNMNVDIYDNQGNKKTTIELLEIFPKSLNDASLSWSETNNLFRITVTFKFKSWKIQNVLNNAFAGVVQSQEQITVGIR